MSALVDLLIDNTDPITSLMLIFILTYLRNIRVNLKEELENTRERVERIEDKLREDK